MQRQKVGGQLSAAQLKQREISQEYLEVEENSQVLTQIVRYSARGRKTPLKFNAPIDLRSFILLIVQKSYLLYTCLLRKVNVLISTDLYARPARRGDQNTPQEAYCEYLLELQLHRCGAEEQEILGKRFKLMDIHKSPYSYGEYLCKFIVFLVRKKLPPQFQRVKNHPESALARQLEELASLIEANLSPQVQKFSAKTVILALEQSEMFRQHSLLLKCLNNSLFGAIRLSPRSKNILQELVELQSGLLAQSKRDQQENAIRIEQSIEESVRLLLKHNVVFSEQSLSEGGKKDTQPTPNTNKAYVMGDVDGTADSRKYFIKLFVRQKPLRKLSRQRLQALVQRAGGAPEEEEGEAEQKDKEKERATRGEYLVQFWAGKNLLCVKYVTGIELNVQNTDILMFHCNYLTYSWNNVTLQFIEKTGKSKRKERYLAFKAISYVHFQQKVLFKVLAMLDLLMVYAKIAQPHLRKNIFSLDDYYHRTAEISAHCEHVKKAFIGKVEKNYQAVQEALNNSKN